MPMSLYTRRNGTAFLKSASGNMQPAAGYYVTVLEPGAVCSASAIVTFPSGPTTYAVDVGHGFAAGDKLIVGTDAATYATVSSVTATTVVVSGVGYVASRGDLLVNLGADGGTTAPSWNGSGVVIYEDSDGDDIVTNSTVTVGTDGEYGYWIGADTESWEVVRSGSSTLDIVMLTSVRSTGTRYAHEYATSGDGLSRSTAWGGWEDAVESANSGDVVHFVGGFFALASGGVTVPSNVSLVGANRGNASSGTTGGTTIKCASGFSGVMFTTATSSWGNRFENLLIDGSFGSNIPIATSGLVIDGCYRAQVYNCDFRLFLGPAVKVTKSGGTLSPGAFRMVGCYIQSAVTASGLSDHTGALHFTDGSEPYIENCWIGCGNSTSTYTESGKQCAIAFVPASFGSTGGFTLVNCNYEYAETGIYIKTGTGVGWSMVGCQGGPVSGHGVYIDASGGRIVGCISRNSSGANDNTYDSWYISANASNINMFGCVADWSSGNKYRYGFNDNGSSGGVNMLIGCQSLDHVTSAYANNHAVTKQSVWLGDRLVSGAFRFVLGSSHIGLGRGVDENLQFAFDGATDDGTLEYRADQGAGVGRRFIFDKNVEANGFHAASDPGGIATRTTFTNATDTPTVDPGWSASATVNMTVPNGYIKAYVGTQAIVIPYWHT